MTIIRLQLIAHYSAIIYLTFFNHKLLADE
jgi:hypothetical protein